MTLGNQNAYKYEEIHKDEVKYYFDILQDKSIGSIKRETGFGVWFISTTINEYIR